MTITLIDINAAIRANFILTKGTENGGKPLTTDWYYESHSFSTARMVFVAIAVLCQFKPDQVCTYLDMSFSEFNAHRKKYRGLYREGEKKYEGIKKGELTYDKSMTNNLDLRVYRKTLLVTNYLKNLQRKRMAFLYE